MKNAIFFALLLIFGSCQYIEKAPERKQLLQKELNAIDWNQVDEYPTVADCEQLSDKEQRRQCFFEYLAQAIQQRLSGDKLTVLYPELDTIDVKVTVFPDSTLKFEPRFSKDTVAYDTIRIDSILHSRLADFPKVSPAIKRGIPVKCEFMLPVILQME